MRLRSYTPLLLLAAATAAQAQNERLSYAWSVDGGKTFDHVYYANGGNPVAEYALVGGTGCLKSLSYRLTGRTTYQPISMDVGAVSPATFQWIQNFFQTGDSKTSGELDVMSGDGGRTTTQMSFSNGLITEVDFPTLDAGAKDAAKMTIKFQPEYTSAVTVKGWNPTAKASVQKKWSPSNFKVSIGGLDTSSLIIVAGVSVGYSYAKRAAIMDNQRTEASMTMSALASGPYQGWLDAFRKSGGDPNLEKEGSIQYFATDGTPIGTLQLHGMGITGLTPTDLDLGGDPNVTMTFYCQSVSFVPAVQ